MDERLSSAKLYDVVTAVVGGVDDREIYIQETLIPRMDKHRGRLQSQTREEIVRKLFSVDVYKPGEVVEIIEETVRAKWELTPTCLGDSRCSLLYSPTKLPGLC